MSLRSSKDTAFVPDKVIGVNYPPKPTYYDQTREHSPTNFENSMAVIDDLEKHFVIRITGTQRRVLEAIARFNLKHNTPTNKEIHKSLQGMTYENIRKIIQRADEKGLIIAMQERKGHEKQYVLANMQDIIYSKHYGSNKGYANKKAIENNDDFTALRSLLKVLIDKPNPEFHHISLKTQLQDKEDYKRLMDWPMPSYRNRAKVLENRISRHRAYKIMVYPNKTITIMINASKHPFRWYSDDDWISLIGLCGSIHQELRSSLSLSEPLIHISESDWTVTQIDIGYDIPQTIEGKSKGSFTSTSSNQCLKVRHLNGVYQIYSKLLPYKINCIRLEEQLNFPSDAPSPNLVSLPNTIDPLAPEQILDIVVSNAHNKSI